ncbi:FecCD family ABC transporter permease [Piscinibacter sp.]|uniref:FecCD family ABC transporter permease n=1 Tax=Piscinibacter sp. TaxID=1903157 RepID=UPI002C766DD2|nr:iron ABC transporter permease [Albitalea sp.]HUG24327.1 iron ABC transporter permease [Albitalea sp.]
MSVCARPASVVACLVAAALGTLLLGLAAGSSGFGFAASEIVWQIRAPRVLAGFGAGAALALAGALMQSLTRNALADPYVLGISSGAAVGALSAMLLGGIGAATVSAWWAHWGVAAGASLGAFGATLLLLGLSWRVLTSSGVSGNQEAPVSLLLIGVMIGSAGSAVVTLLLTFAPEVQLRGMVFWLLGDLNGATHWIAVWTALLLALAATWPWAHQLDWLARGDAWAATLGVPVVRRRRQVLLAAALATGAAVATGGAIGFVGLVAPHALRLLGLRHAPWLLPASALAGGAFVVLADAAARTVVAPVQLPVGVLAAAVGVPSFLVLLLRGPRGVRR